jgi:flagellar basal-body rod modification protein FlgD
MNITPTGSVSAQPTPTSDTSTGASTGAAGPDSLDYDAFLQLLIAQMKNQDPSKPADPSQFISQLASFSSVEQAIKTNNKLDSLMTSLALSQSEGLIGRTVTSADGSVSGTVAGIRIISGGAVAILSDGQQLTLGAGVTVT